MEDIRVLSNKEEIIAEYLKFGTQVPECFVAFYHGGLNAILLDRTLMLVHYFDRQVHRGYCVFDTLKMTNHRLYQFHQHMDRFTSSMAIAKLKPPKTPEQICEIIARIASATGESDLSFRFWCSRGALDCNITTPDEVPTVFYLAAIKGEAVPMKESLSKAFTVDIEIKSPLLASIKTTNYLLNCMAADQAAKKGGAGIMVTDDGYIVEAAVQSPSFVLKDGTYYTPPYVRALRSITQDRMLELVKTKLIPSGLITKISRDRKKVDELKNEALEMMLMGGDKITPIGSWDEKEFSNEVGPITKILMKLIAEDYTSPEASYKIQVTKS